MNFADTSAYIDDAIFDEELCALSQNSQSGTRLSWILIQKLVWTKKNKSLIKQVKALFIKSYLLQTKFKLKFLNLAHL